ncbi:GNAT family N-acetyltransferase [Altererythrobacter aestiaquae]|uniref:GNAT family N-acetyltransferase n=1 Tax=Pontixanthobacter aestiaquae TaxID=1509367 RepID=A0A844Z7A8_9SPHN|nr:GNAT family N-acetyltransferase [Pontixanthobacter aestiaquae]
MSLSKGGLDGAAAAAPEGVCAGQIRSASWRQILDDSFVEEWNALTQIAVEPNPFFESWNLCPALTAFDPKGAVELVTFRQNGVLCGLLPIERAKVYYGYLIPHISAWLHDNAFCGVPLVARGAERAFWQALLRWASDSTRSALLLHLMHLPEDSPLVEALSSSLEANQPAAIVHREERAMLRSGQSSEDYFTASMSGKKRKELRRQFNRLSDLGTVAIEREKGSTQITRWIDTFLALEAAGWKGKEGSALASNTDTEQLFRQSLAGAAKAGRLERLSLTLSGRPIALLANFVSAPGVFSFKTTFDEDYARFSPGVLLQRENLKLLDNSAIEWADSCAAADHPMIERIWREKRSIVRINVGLGGALRQTAFKHMIRAENGSEDFGQ